MGHVDTRDRPILQLLIPNREDSFLVIVDSGFNRQLLIHERDAARLRCDFTDVIVEAEFAGGERRELKIARSRIYWFGRLRDIEVLITAVEQPRASLPDEPIGLLGTGLLSPHRLTIDFATRRVAISEHGNS